MLDLIRMEWYKLRTSKLFIVLLSVTFALNLLLTIGILLVNKLITQTTPPPQELAALIASPMPLSLLMITMFISAVSFLYSDYTGGYVKNIAGQLRDRGMMVFSKFIVLAVHNLAFYAVLTLTAVLGTAIAGQISLDSAVLPGVMTLLLKWLLSMALCSIVMFFAFGIGNKVLASIIGVVFATGSLSLLYIGIDTAMINLFKFSNCDIGSFLPDSLISSVNCITNTNVINAAVVSAVFIALFVTLTYMVFKKRDVK